MTTVLATQSHPQRLGLLHHHDFRLLWLGETASCFGSSVGSVSLPLVALGMLHAGVLPVSLLSAAAWLPWLVVGLPAGAWVDRLPRRRIMITADIMSAVAFGTIPLAATMGWLSIAQLLVVALLSGTASVFFDTAYRAMMPGLLDPTDLLEGNAKLQGSEQVARVAAPGAAGVIAQASSPLGGIVVDAVSFVVSALCLAQVQINDPPFAVPRRRLRTEIGEGLRIVVHDPLLRVQAVFGCLANLTLTGYGAVIIVFLVRTLHLRTGTVGLLLATGSIGGVVGAGLARRVAARIGTARTVLASKLSLMPFALLIPLTRRGPGTAFFVTGTLVIVAGTVAGNVIWSGFIQSSYPPKLLGRISTSVQFVNYGAMPLGAALAGAIAKSAGTRTTLWIMLGGLVASTFVLLVGPLKTMRDFPMDRSTAGQVTPSLDVALGG